MFDERQAGGQRAERGRSETTDLFPPSLPPSQECASINFACQSHHCNIVWSHTDADILRIV